MQYIAYAQRGEFEKCAEASFDCVMCGICSSRCPAGITHPQVGHACPPSERQVPRSQERSTLRSAYRKSKHGDFQGAHREASWTSRLSELKELYNNREHREIRRMQNYVSHPKCLNP